jgi:hypothetical protein
MQSRTYSAADTGTAPISVPPANGDRPGIRIVIRLGLATPVSATAERMTGLTGEKGGRLMISAPHSARKDRHAFPE